MGKEEGHPLVRLEELANIEGAREMGPANAEREAHPMAAMEVIRDKTKELHEIHLNSNITVKHKEVTSG